MTSNTSVAIESETYDLPENAKIGGTWKLPKSYIDTYDSINAPYWEFEEPEFTAYIKAVKRTDDPNTLEIEYWVYRSNPAHCNGYYGLWDTGKALVNTKTHRRWNVD